MDIDTNKSYFIRHYDYFILIAIVVISFIYQLILFTIYPYSYGVDGAYYDLNVINILETGKMWSDDNPFIFYYCALWSLLLSNVTLGIKVGIVSLCSLIPVPTFFIVKKFTKNSIAALFGAFISTFNPLLFRMMGDFVKNAAGVLFLLLFVYFFIITCEKKYSIKKTSLLYCLCYGLFIIIVFTHIYPTGFAVGFVFLYFLYAIIYSLINERKGPWNEIKIISFLGISVGLTLFFGYLISPEYFDQFSKIAQFINGLLTTNMQIFKQPPPEKPYSGIDSLMMIILSIVAIIGAILIIMDLFRKKKGPKILQFFGFCMILYLPTYLIVPNITEIPSGFFIPHNDLINFLIFLTTFPVTGGLALICFEIYKNDPELKSLNRIKGNLLAIFLMAVVLAMPFISMEWRTRFAFMNFVPISLYIGYGIRKLDIGKKQIIAFIIIGFFSTSMIIQTNYFCFYSFRPVLTHAGEDDLLFLKNYVESNSSLSGSIVIIEDLGLYYFTILITNLDAVKSGNPSEIAMEYNETVFHIIPKYMHHIYIPPSQKIIRNEPYGQLIIVLANETYHD
ncbi:MAG: hypothetical protein ACTSPY_04860 [Candidatus Helarchaeota archaeon]